MYALLFAPTIVAAVMIWRGADRDLIAMAWGALTMPTLLWILLL